MNMKIFLKVISYYQFSAAVRNDKAVFLFLIHQAVKLPSAQSEIFNRFRRV